MSSKNYRPDVDGLRAVSVIAVILYHGRMACPGGFLGVDVFFVISGFLITSLIVRDLDTGSFSFMDFWARRVRRILPALTVVILATLALTSLFMLPLDLQSVANSGFAQSLFSANIYFWRNMDYFAGQGERMPLLHTWSLAVEEQFYFVFPFVVAWSWTKDHKRMLAILGLGFLGSLALCVAGSRYSPPATFYLLPTRAWQMILGGLTACLAGKYRPGQFFAEGLSFAGLAAILWSICFLDEFTRLPSEISLIPSLGAVALIWPNGDSPTLVQRVLALKPVVFVGVISYSLYLWHWPLLALMNYCLLDSATLPVRVGVVALGAVAGVLSWRYIETPFRRPVAGWSPKRVVVSGLAASAVPLVLWGIVAVTGGLAGRFPVELRQYLATSNADGALKYRANGFGKTEDVELPQIGVADQKPCFCVWGDSHALHLGRILDEIAKEKQVSGGMAVRMGAIPLLDCARDNGGPASKTAGDTVLNIVRHNQIKHVLLVGRWAMYVDGRLNGATDTLVFDPQSKSRTYEESKLAFRRGVESTLKAFREAGVEVWVVRMIPEQEINITWSVVASRSLGVESPHGVARTKYSKRLARIDEGFRECGLMQQRYIDFESDFYGDGEFCRVFDDGGIFYFDDDHISHYGAEKVLRSRLTDFIATVAADCVANE